MKFQSSSLNILAQSSFQYSSYYPVDIYFSLPFFRPNAHFSGRFRLIYTITPECIYQRTSSHHTYSTYICTHLTICIYKIPLIQINLYIKYPYQPYIFIFLMKPMFLQYWEGSMLLQTIFGESV